MAKKTDHNRNIMYIAILLIGLMLLPFLLGAIQQRAFMEGYASNRLYNTGN